jgi:hypothetical protein
MRVVYLDGWDGFSGRLDRERGAVVVIGSAIGL